MTATKKGAKSCCTSKREANHGLLQSNLLMSPVVALIACAVVVVGAVVARSPSNQKPNSKLPPVSSTALMGGTELLFQHLTSRRAFFNFKPALFDGELVGVAAATKLEPQQLLMVLPMDEVMHHGTFDTAVLKALKSARSRISRAQLALSLAYERSQGSSSRFYHFINTLPTHVNNYVAWPAALLGIMDLAIPGARANLALELREMSEANKHLPQPLPERDLLWAFGVVQTRAFARKNDTEILIPAASSFNHHSDKAKATPMPHCSQEQGKCFMRAGKWSVNPGEQMFLHYRSWSNLQLLIRYGFAAPGNEWGPEVEFAPLANLPAWLRAAGCHKKTLHLREIPLSKGVPLENLNFQCAAAAAMVDQSDSRSSEVEHLWKSGAFVDNMKGVVPSSVYREMSMACRDEAGRWSGPEAIQAIHGAAQYAKTPAKDVLNALSHDLQLLHQCEAALRRLAEETNVSLSVSQIY